MVNAIMARLHREDLCWPWWGDAANSLTTLPEGIGVVGGALCSSEAKEQHVAVRIVSHWVESGGYEEATQNVLGSCDAEVLRMIEGDSCESNG